MEGRTNAYSTSCVLDAGNPCRHDGYRIFWKIALADDQTQIIRDRIGVE